MSTAKERLFEMKARIKQLQQEMLESSKTLFFEVANEIFAAHPKLQAFGWNQYTPYFNDGEECIFCVSSDYLDIRFGEANEKIDADDYEEQEEMSVWSLKYNMKNGKELNEKETAAFAVGEFLDAFEDDTMKFMFGNHISVLVKRDGTVATSEYSHD
jgi:hypothetical protein